jgi:hypothetical protein
MESISGGPSDDVEEVEGRGGEEQRGGRRRSVLASVDESGADRSVESFDCEETGGGERVLEGRRTL